MSSRLASCALTSLTRRVGNLGLSNSKPLLSSPFTTVAATTNSRLLVPKTTTTPWASSVLPSFGIQDFALDNNNPFSQTTRTMVTRKKRLARRAKRRLEAKRAEKGGKGKEDQVEEVAAPQHEEWVDFQKSIAVGGFQTGQTTKARVQRQGESGQKLRDLKQREKLEMRLAAKRPDTADIRGGEYPVLRYSDEETERLLKMAYAAIPLRAGKRGTRNKKRQKRRWWLVRKIHAKKKKQVIAAHFRKMDKRSETMRQTAEIKQDAVEIRAKDRNYQKEVLRRWMENLKQSGDKLAY